MCRKVALRWAEKLIATRQPDVVIGDGYLRRWHILPRNRLMNLYLHEFVGSDDDRALHDHPWPSLSWVLLGVYWEHLPNKAIRLREAGNLIPRSAKTPHRIELASLRYSDKGRAVTLFMTGPKVREWGFHCPKGWVHWEEFCYEEEGVSKSRGCGED